MARIIVCGDIMLDHNIITYVEKIANEAPIPVFNFQSETYNLGGCGNVLKNIHSIGCEKLYIFSAVGNDENGKRICELVDTLGVENHIDIIDTYKTTTKTRYFCDNRIVFRCDVENDNSGIISSSSFIEGIRSILENGHIDCIILSDYNKGILSYSQCQHIIQLANKHGVFTCVDPKGDPEKYKGCTLIKPNRSEAYRLFNIDKNTTIENVHKIIFD